MKDLMVAVLTFHEKMGHAVNSRLTQEVANSKGVSHFALDKLHMILAYQASAMFELAIEDAKRGDRRLWRVHLMLEELSELVLSMKENNEVDCADAIGDLIYTVAGTAVTLGLPMQTVFVEIQRSNMTKVGKGATAAKGGKYSPPDIQHAIDYGRVNEEWCNDDNIEDRKK